MGQHFIDKEIAAFRVRDGSSLAEIDRYLDACRAANPAHLVRVLGYDPKRQTLGLAFVTHR